MNDVVIRCESLSKQYRIGERERYTALRDVISNAAGARLRLLMNALSSRFKVSNLSNNSQSEMGSPRVKIGEGSIWALQDVSFEVKRGEVVGIIGRNGAGKSTLLKILSRITKPTKGHAEIHGRVGSLLEVGTGFHPELTGRENIYLNGAILGMRKTEIDRKFDEIVAFAEIEKFIDTSVKRYSSGMYVRLAFAVAAHMEPEVLVIDEVLAVGDAAFQKKCLGKMNDVARGGRTVLFVSHNMGAISHLCTSGILLRNGRAVFLGSATEAIGAYDQDLQSFVRRDGSSQNILFAAPQNGNDTAILSVEILDIEGRPKAVIRTWDDVVFRVHFSSSKHVRRGAVVLEVASIQGARLLLLSNQPDGTLPLSFEPGVQTVDCIIEQLPLAAGQYVLGGGLGVPGVEYLWRQPELAVITVLERDVYGSGLPPVTSRCLLATKHHWRVVNSAETTMVSADQR